MEKRFEYYAQLAAVLILVVGCFLVLQPFLTAILFAAVVCVSTWPLYLWLLSRMKGRKNLAALAMTLSLIITVILPLALVAYNLADNITVFYDQIRAAIEEGPLQPPAWLTGLPLVGESIKNYWHLIASSQEEMMALLKRLLEPTRKFLLAGGILLGQGVMEMSLAAFVSFFLYRDGEALVNSLDVAMERLAGLHSVSVLDTVNNTVRGVMYGLVGTALAQGFVATVGFVIAGVPAAMLLGVATFVLSLIPAGPPLIWGGAAIWLFYQGSMGWGIFMLLWGVLLISSVDNIVKPLLISRGSNLPFILVMFGVMGGVLAFGFVGIFIGPTLLAVGFSLMRKWTAREHNEISSET
ncbi:MAG: AI-2E family transporter [Sulfurimicrobium sp.]|nr:AI-2E family transporter [Sulfurimicrobium sp.]MDO9189267.1 AI-2E family transporter [Sulfurimicrobium sp.]MDP2199242.1 AI-2E family transporter [Sulfurimicrobium sp.]MDP3686772.1 AI-2E family transporter [Sulfurimicrobium sp.]